MNGLLCKVGMGYTLSDSTTVWDVVCFPCVGIMNGYEWETFEMKLTSFRGFMIRAFLTPNQSQKYKHDQKEIA